MIIKNNIQDKDKIKQIFDICDSNFFPYYWNENQIDSDLTLKQYGGFTHIFYSDNKINSPLYDIFYNVILDIAEKENITIKLLHRLQANLSLNINIDDVQFKNSIHQDMDLPNYKTILYYINDSDGDTVIYDNNKNVIDSILPFSGNYIIFDSMTFHRSTIPKNSKKRMVVNCIIEV
jgi:hypothetical protein